jgi:exodeoxyribonuclease III
VEVSGQLTQRCKIVTYNVNSLRARIGFLSLFLDEHQPDIICLQELKGTEEQLEEILNKLRLRGYHLSVHAQPRWNGVLIGSKQPIEYSEMKFEGELFEEQRQSRFQYIKTFGIHLLNLYCPQGQSSTSSKFQYKKQFYKHLIDWIERHITRSSYWVVTGDFNIAPLTTDVWDVDYWKEKPTYHPDEHALWAELLECGLLDVGKIFLPDRSYTFFDNRTYKWAPEKGLRIDHFLGNTTTQSKVTSCKVHREWRNARLDSAMETCKPSDHVPIELVLQLPVVTSQSQITLSEELSSNISPNNKNTTSYSESDSESSGLRSHSISELIQIKMPFDNQNQGTSPTLSKPHTTTSDSQKTETSTVDKDFDTESTKAKEEHVTIAEPPTSKNT